MLTVSGGIDLTSSFPESVCEGFFRRTASHLHLHIFTSAHPHSHLYLCSSSHLHSQLQGAVPPEHHRSCVSSARNAGESAISLCPSQPSAEIVRVECAKCRRECNLVLSRAALCGDRACRVREMQARVQFGFVPGSPLRRSCVSSARNAGESAICPGRGQPSAEIVRVECAKCRRERDLSRSGTTLCGDRACRMREVRFVPVAGNALRRSCVSSARDAGESAFWPGGATLCGDRALGTGDFVVQL